MNSEIIKKTYHANIKLGVIEHVCISTEFEMYSSITSCIISNYNYSSHIFYKKVEGELTYIYV